MWDADKGWRLFLEDTGFFTSETWICKTGSLKTIGHTQVTVSLAFIVAQIEENLFVSISP